MTKRNHPMCRVCNWAKGGQDSRDGKACKCGLSEPPLLTCGGCGGYGKVPYNIGWTVCIDCDGSGLHGKAVQP